MNNEKRYAPDSEIPSDERSSIWSKLLIFGAGIMIGMTILMTMGVLKELFFGPDDYIPGDTVQNLTLLQENLPVIDFALMFVEHDDGTLPPASPERNVLDALQAHGYDIEVKGLFFPRQAKDPFTEEHSPLRYFPLGEQAYILVSNGPDMDIDIDERTLDPETMDVSTLIYNPANGLNSEGDIIYMRRGEVLTTPVWSAESLAQ